MELIFELAENQTRSSRQKSAATFFEAGGVIGRSPDSDWVLEDKSRKISGKHAEIFFEDGQFFITDRSTNGTFDTKANARLQKNEDYPIAHGDSYRIGKYIFRARVCQDAEAMMAAESEPLDLNGLIPDDEFLEADPFAVLASEEAGPAKTEILPEFELDDDLNDLEQPFSAPSFSVTTIPDDDDDLLTELEIETPIMTKPIATIKPRVKTAATVDVTEAEESDSSPLLALLSRELGIDLTAMNANEQKQAIQNLGKLTRQTVIGLQQLLRTRADFKNKLRLATTMVQETNNNPLKLVGNYEQTLKYLLTDQTGYLSGPQAVKHALKDLQSHQVASFAASRGIQDATFDAFSPAQLVYRFEQQGKPGRFTSKEAFYWQQYEQYFRKLSGDQEWRQSQFMQDYTRIYEEQAHYIHAAWTEFEGKA